MTSNTIVRRDEGLLGIDMAGVAEITGCRGRADLDAAGKMPLVVAVVFGVTEALGVSNSMGAAGAYVGWQDTFNVDPDTTVAWTSAGLDDLRVGIKFA